MHHSTWSSFKELDLIHKLPLPYYHPISQQNWNRLPVTDSHSALSAGAPNKPPPPTRTRERGARAIHLLTIEVFDLWAVSMVPGVVPLGML